MLATGPDLQKLHYAFVLRNATVGWTLALGKEYFAFLRHAESWSGGASFHGFLKNIEQDAWDNASDVDRLALEATAPGSLQGSRIAQTARARPNMVKGQRSSRWRDEAEIGTQL